jgi:hypothetical protein
MIQQLERDMSKVVNCTQPAQRAGLSTLEFLGCVIAVIGGIWLGALYLGVDVRHVAHTALAEAQLLDKVPPEWRPPAPDDKAMTREQLVATLREELGALRNELSSLRTGGDSGDSTEGNISQHGQDKSSVSLGASKEQTLAYWSRINEIALSEAALQQDAESAANGANAARVFAIKGRISRFAAKSVEAIPSEGVDELVIQFGRQLALWYDRGGELYERAVRIWETPTIGQNREQLNQDWRRTELQHRNEALLIKEKAVVVGNAASRRFGEQFPDFAKPLPPEVAPATGASVGTGAGPVTSSADQEGK